MPKVIIEQQKCKGCLLCVSACPKGLIKESGSVNKQGLHFAVFEGESSCSGCAMCALMCPDCCIEICK